MEVVADDSCVGGDHQYEKDKNLHTDSSENTRYEVLGIGMVATRNETETGPSTTSGTKSWILRGGQGSFSPVSESRSGGGGTT